MASITKKQGACGGYGGAAQDMDITGITRIVKVSIRHSFDVINAIGVCFERNGTTECTDIWGGQGGDLTEINLQPHEYITALRGYVGSYGDLFIVRSLVLETNLAVYGPYGMETEIPFELSTPGCQVIGFHGRSGDVLDAIGVYVQENIVTTKVGPCGGSGGSAKDMNPMGITRIVKVGIRHADSINALSVCYIRNDTTECTEPWGGQGGVLTEINLQPDEHITSVRGYVGSYGDLFIVRSLELTTNLASYGPYGSSVGVPYELSALNGQIVGFHGRSGTNLDAIGVYIQGRSATSIAGASGTK